MKSFADRGQFAATVVLAIVATLATAAPRVAQPGAAGSPGDAAKASPAPAPILGFTAASAAREWKAEQEFARVPTAERTRQWHRYFTQEPHPAASARNNELASYIAEQWKQQGWEDVVLRKYEVLHSAPRQVSLEMVAPVEYK